MDTKITKIEVTNDKISGREGLVFSCDISKKQIYINLYHFILV